MVDDLHFIAQTVYLCEMFAFFLLRKNMRVFSSQKCVSLTTHKLQSDI